MPFCLSAQNRAGASASIYCLQPNPSSLVHLLPLPPLSRGGGVAPRRGCPSAAAAAGAGERARLSSSLGSGRGCEARAAARRPSDAFPQRGGAAARVAPMGVPRTRGLRREQTQVKVASHPTPLFPSSMASVDLCLLPSLLGRSEASMAGSGASMVRSVLPRLWPPSWVKSRLRPVAELQGGHTQVSRGGLGHGSALKLDQCRPNLGAIRTFLFFVLSFLLVGQCRDLFFIC